MQRQQQAGRQTSRLTFSLQYLPTRISGAEYLHDAMEEGEETCNRSCTPSWWADVSRVMADGGLYHTHECSQKDANVFQSTFTLGTLGPRHQGLVGYHFSTPGQPNDHLDLRGIAVVG